MKSNIAQLAQRIKEDPSDSFSKFALALELLKINEDQKALKLFNNIVAEDPNYVGVYYHLGKLLEQLSENKKALENYKSGIEISRQINDKHAESELLSAYNLLLLEIE